MKSAQLITLEEELKRMKTLQNNLGKEHKILKMLKSKFNR